MRDPADVLTTLRKRLESSNCGLFATKSSMEEAADYTRAVLQAAGPASRTERDNAITITFAIYHNTLVRTILDMITEIEDDSEIEEERDE